MSDSLITYNQRGDAVSFSGPDAVECFRAAALASAMILYKAGMSPGRGTMTGPQALKAATRYTGQTYKRGEYDRARADIQEWVRQMKLALPEETRP